MAANAKIQSLAAKSVLTASDLLPIAAASYLEATISGATQANPVVVTAASHGFSNGDQVYIAEVVGMTQLNGNTYTVAGQTTNTFQLSGVNGSGYGAYSSGGKAVRGRLQKTRAVDLVNATPNGLSYVYTNSTASTDPGSGKIGFGSTTFSSITGFRISYTDAKGVSVVDLLMALTDAEGLGLATLYMFKKADPYGTFAVFELGELSDWTTWKSGSAVYQDHAGTFANNDEVILQILPRVPRRLGGTGEFSSNFNDMEYTGFYTASSATHQPVSGNTWAVQSHKYNSTTQLQIAHSIANAPLRYLRTMASGVWGSWVRADVSVFSSISTTATIDANVTHRVKCSGASDYTVTIATATAVDDHCEFVNTGSAVVTLDPASTAQIYEAPGGAVGTLKLYPGESARIQWDGAYWVILDRKLVPHCAEVTRAAAQSIANGITYVAIQHDTTIMSFGVTVDLSASSSNGVTIARSGWYSASHNFGMPALSVGSAISVNGTGVLFGTAAPIAGAGRVNHGSAIYLSAGDVVRSSVVHSAGSATNTSTATNARPTLRLVEM